jgi:hypothetical protein
MNFYPLFISDVLNPSRNDGPNKTDVVFDNLLCGIRLKLVETKSLTYTRFCRHNSVLKNE